MKYYKLFSFFTVIVLCFTNMQCDDDDFNGNTIRFTNNNVVQIENNTTVFNVNDIITIETTINNNQTTDNNTDILLSDYDYGEVGQSFYINTLKLYKLTAFGTLTEIPLTNDNIQSIEGETTTTGFERIEVKSVFNGSTYKNRFSIMLLEPGTFYLAGDSFKSHNDGKLSITGGVYSLNYVEINSTIVNANENGAYEFVVN